MPVESCDESLRMNSSCPSTVEDPANDSAKSADRPAPEVMMHVVVPSGIETPELQGLTPSTFRLKVSPLCGLCWVHDLPAVYWTEGHGKT